MSKFKITNADSPIEKDLYQDIPIKDPDTGLDQVDSEGNILAKRYVTRSINKNGINNIKRALPQINVNKSEIARIDTYAKNQVDAINTSIRDIEDNVLQNQKDLSDHDTRISTIQSKLNNIQGIDIDEVQADVEALKKSAYLITGGVLKGDVSIQTPNTAVLTLTPKGSSSYASFSTTNDVLDCTTTWGNVFKASEEGKYFYGLADKATADKRGQDVTSYIRSITGANATLTITKGDGTSQSLSINNVLQATKAIQDKNGAQIDTTYFKAANGTFTGAEYFRDVPNSLLRFNGGNTHDGGASLVLYGKDANGAQGVFDLVACTKEDASDAKRLIGTPAGALTWDNKHIVRSINGINANAFGDVALTQLVTGLITSTYLAGATGAALVSSTAPGGAYVAFTRGASKNGVFCTSTYEDRYEVHYINNEMINAGQNGITKTVTLLNEAGNSSFPGIVSGTFSGNLSGTASHATASDTANSAGNADTLDGLHEYSFLRLRGNTSANGEGTLWSQIGIKEYHNALPDGLSGLYAYGEVVSFAGGACRFDIYCSHQSSNGNGLLYRSGWGDDKQPWRYFIDSANIGSQSVNHATNADSANEATNAYNLRTNSHADHFVKSEWDGSYFWTWVRAPDGGYRAVRVERANSAGYADNAGTASRSTNNGSFFISGYEISIG